MSKKRKMNIVDQTPEQAAQEQALAQEQAALEAAKAEAKAEKEAKPKKPAVEWIVAPNGARILPGTVMATQYQLFTRPLETALTFDQIVDELVKAHPEQSRERHAFTVRRRSATFCNKYGIKIGIDEQGRISTAIEGRKPIGRRFSPEDLAARAEREAQKELAKQERAAAKAAEKAAREEAKAAAKAEKEAAKAKAKAEAEAAKAAAAEAAKQ